MSEVIDLGDEEILAVVRQHGSWLANAGVIAGWPDANEIIRVGKRIVALGRILDAGALKKDAPSQTGNSPP